MPISWSSTSTRDAVLALELDLQLLKQSIAELATSLDELSLRISRHDEKFSDVSHIFSRLLDAHWVDPNAADKSR